MKESNKRKKKIEAIKLVNSNKREGVWINWSNGSHLIGGGGGGRGGDGAPRLRVAHAVRIKHQFRAIIIFIYVVRERQT